MNFNRLTDTLLESQQVIVPRNYHRVDKADWQDHHTWRMDSYIRGFKKLFKWKIDRFYLAKDGIRSFDKVQLYKGIANGTDKDGTPVQIFSGYNDPDYVIMGDGQKLDPEDVLTTEKARVKMSKLNKASAKSGKPILGLKFGRYQMFSKDRKGYKIPFDYKEFSTPTRKNLQKIEILGYKWADYFWKSPVDQGGSIAFTYAIPGTDPNGQPVFFLRKETASKGAGQTYVVWEKKRVFASALVEEAEQVERNEQLKNDPNIKYVGDGLDGLTFDGRNIIPSNISYGVIALSDVESDLADHVDLFKAYGFVFPDVAYVWFGSQFRKLSVGYAIKGVDSSGDELALISRQGTNGWYYYITYPKAGHQQHQYTEDAIPSLIPNDIAAHAAHKRGDFEDMYGRLTDVF